MRGSSPQKRSSLVCSVKHNMPEHTPLIEVLADLEHQQWAKWTAYMLDNMTDERVAIWRRQIEAPYAELSKKEKDSDRKEAWIVLDAVMDHLKG